MTLGLFAKHVVIPICDGHEAERDFESLLNSMHEDLLPVGMFEAWLVVKIAECMWRLRRATRCESGSVRELAIGGDHRDENQVILGLASELGILAAAEEQLRNFGTLSQESYAEVLPFVEEERQKQIQSAIGAKPVQRQFDDGLFLSCITDRKESLGSMYRAFSRVEGDRSDARLDHHALPPVENMDRILRYEERMHRQLDWALQRLLESQERRKTSQLATGSPLFRPAEIAKRSQ
ncbi:MAG: hypothetical protein ACM34E_02045 [Acidobacteriota bacterium]